jgi:hypothetical protein
VVLYEIPQVKELAVLAIASQPVAFVITREERSNADAIIAYCKRRIPPEPFHGESSSLMIFPVHL